MPLNTEEQQTLEVQRLAGLQEQSGPPNSPGSSTPRRRVLIADDHEVTRQGVRTLLASQPDIDVCGEAADGLEAVNLVWDLQPDLVVLDSSMPRAGGLYAAHMIRDAGVNCKILIFADHRFPQLEATLRTIHCDGFVLKSNVASDFLRAVRALLAGQEFFPSVAANGKTAGNST